MTVSKEELREWTKNYVFAHYAIVNGVIQWQHIPEEIAKKIKANVIKDMTEKRNKINE